MDDKHKIIGSRKDILAVFRKRILELEKSEVFLKKTEYGLRESEEKFKILSEQSYLGIIILQDGLVKYVNQALADMLDYSIEEMLNWKPNEFAKVVHPDDYSFALEQTRKKQNGFEDVVNRYQYSLVTKNGDTIWVDQYSKTIMYEGRYADFATIVDITDRKRAWDLARAQRDLGLSLCGMHGLDETLRLCVEAAIRISGMDCGGVYLVDETSGAFDLAFHKGLPPDFVKSASHFESDSDNVRLVMAGKTVYTQHHDLGVPLDEAERLEGLRAIAVIPVHHDDKVIACINIASHTLDKVPDLARISLEAIATQIGSAIIRSKAEEAVRESEEKYRNLIEQANDGIIICQDNVLKFVNNRMAQMIGYAVNELVGTEFFKYISPKDRDIVNERLETRMSRKYSSNHYEIGLVKKDGEIIDVDINRGVIEYEKRASDFVFIRDITEKKKAEIELKRSKKELQKAYEELKELDRMKTEFAAIATHEIGTPLSVVKSNVEMLQEGIFGNTTPDQDYRLGIIGKNINYLVKLNREMMDISRIDSRRLKLKKEQGSISDLIKDISKEVAPLARDKKLEVSVISPKKPAIATYDNDRIRQVMDNLLNNAIKFTPQHKEIKIRIEDKKECVLIAVADSGIGIPKEEQEKIFERFYEVGNYLNHETGGAGLGLAIVKGIVEAHGGEVWVDSDVGVGSTFYFTLPKG